VREDLLLLLLLLLLLKRLWLWLWLWRRDFVAARECNSTLPEATCGAVVCAVVKLQRGWMCADYRIAERRGKGVYICTNICT
jgi:hypothetical protein